MEYKIVLRYSKELIQQAVLSYWIRTVGYKFLFVLIILIFFFFISILNHDLSWKTGALGMLLVLGLILVIAIYITHYKNSLQKLQDLGKPEATFSISNNSFTFKSSAGTATLPWSSVSEIWKFKDYWLILFSKAQFSTIPTQEISAEALAFIDEQVRKAGGKVD